MADWEDAPNSGWEDGAWEDAPEEKGFWSTAGDYATQLAKNVGGGLVGAADLAAGAISAPVGYLKAAGAVAMGADPEKELEEARQVSTDNVGAALARLGLGDPRENITYRQMMLPFEKLGELTHEGAEALGLGASGQIAAEGALSLLPIPGGKLVGKGLGRVAEHVDPALRNLDAEGVSGTRERVGLGDWEDAVPVRETSTDGPVTVSWDHPDVQAEMMQPINPYDVGGHVSEAMEGRYTQIDPLQADLLGRVENIDQVPDVLRDVVDAYKTQEFTNKATQGDLFENYTNQHRAYDQYGNEPLPRELTRAEFEDTVRNLAKEEGTRYELPENMDKAYEDYRATINDRQGGLFDRESQRAGFDATARNEGLARLRAARDAQIEAHPSVKGGVTRLEKAIAKLEEMRADGADAKYIAAQERKVAGAEKTLATARSNVDKNMGDIDMSAYGERVRGEAPPPVELGPSGMEVGLAANFQARMNPERGQRPASVPETAAVPPTGGQAFKELADGIPVLRDVVVDQPAAPAPRAPSRDRGVTPSATVTKSIPGLGKKAERFIHENLTPEQVVQSALGEKDGMGGAAARLSGSGANLTSLTRAGGRGSALIKGVYGFWNAAENATRKVVSERVLPIERSLHSLSRADRELLASVMKNEMMNQALSERVPPRLQDAYNRLRDGLRDAGNAVNEARVSQGLEPMTLTDYYLSSRWRGNYKMEVRGPDGELVYYLREPSKRQLRKAQEALDKAVPGLVFKEVEPTFRGDKNVDQLEAGYMEMLKILDPNDPRVEVLRSAYEDHVAGNSVPSLGMPFHAEAKGNVRGFIGDRPNRTEKQNAIELLNSQIQYMKNSYKWAEQQKANQKTSEVLANPELRETQPNNVKYAQEYSKNAMGFGTAKSIRDLETDLARGLGMDREQVMSGLNWMRAWFYTKQLGMLNPKAMFVQMVQPLFMMPAHVNLLENGVKADIGKVISDTMVDAHKLWFGKKQRPHMQEALDYAEANGILSINVLDDIRNIGQSEFSRKAQNLANINQIKAEEFGRTVSYIQSINHFYQAGLRGETLYRSAEALTNRVMVDYRKFEQPIWMEKLGLTGRAAGTLKTFVNNQYHQLLYYMQEAGKGRVSGLAAMIGLQVALGGALGFYGVDTASSIYDNGIRPLLGPKYADTSMKGTLLTNMDDLVAYGLFSKVTGLNMHGSLSQGTIGGDSVMSAVAPFAEDLGKSAWSLGKAALDPTNPDKWMGALYENLPPHGKGAMETFAPQYTTESGMSVNPRDLNKGMYKRDTFEKAVRVLGATSIKESATKERAYEASKREMAISEAKTALITGYVDARRRGDRDQMKTAVDVLSRWMAPDELAQALTNGVINAEKNRNQDVVRRNMPDNLNTVGNIRKYQRQEEIRGPR